MNPTLSDPNNHAPELAPGDDWGDDERVGAARPPTIGVLPPRRNVGERLAVVAEPAVEIGLNIDSRLTRGEDSQTPRRLEVQEIGGSVVKLQQTAPAPPKVERLFKFHERPTRETASENRQGEGMAWGASKRHSTRWLILSGVGIVAVVIVGLVLLPFINAPNKGRDRGEAASTMVAEEEIEGVDSMNRMVARQAEAMRRFRSYATANSWDEVASLTRPDQAKDLSLKAGWKPLGISREWSPPTDCTWTVDKLGKDFYGKLEGELPDHTRFAAYFIQWEDNLMLDWKATTGFGTATFGQLAEGQGDPQEIRGKISPADFYTATWPETEYQSYRFVSPDGTDSVWCYALRTELANALIAPSFNQGEIIQEAKDALPFTLRLQRGPGDAPPNQWVIGEVHFEGWIKP